jgi:hypothetical protein
MKLLTDLVGTWVVNFDVVVFIIQVTRYTAACQRLLRRKATETLVLF